LDGKRQKAVAADMSPPYIAAVLMHLPKATLVFDRFRMIKLSNDGLSDLRRKLCHEATDLRHKQVSLNSKSWLFTKPGSL
jgi:transposase